MGNELLEELVDRLAARVAARVAEHLPPPQAAAPPPTAREPQYLKTKEAAKLLSVGASTLELWRAKGRGPAFVKLPGAGGAVRYKLADLDAWLAAHARKPK